MNYNILKKIMRKEWFYGRIEVLTIFILAIIPLFMRFHYKINIYLSWEGAYRLYLGEIPYKDFGIPMGFGYWLVPALFFKIFGPYLVSLIKAQVFLNLVSGFSFIYILKSFKLKPAVRCLSVILFCISYSFNNFWPWYNHTVIVYQFVGFAFLLPVIQDNRKKYWVFYVISSSFFLFLSFFTKQDAGALGIFISLVLLTYNLLFKKSYKPFILFIGSGILFGLLFIVPFIEFRIGYWFNYGQAPHNSRLSIYDLLDGFLKGSSYIKFYILLIFMIVVTRLYQLKSFKPKINSEDFSFGLFLVFTLAILFEALIFQVSSYVPADNNIFYHSFAFAFILSGISISQIFERKIIFYLGVTLIFIWWSSVFWQYLGVFQTWARKSQNTKSDTLINMNTYVIHPPDTSFVPQWEWGSINLISFSKILLPNPTIMGINRILKLPIIKKPGFKLLNMTELTPLEYELHANLETGRNIPMWYHRGVGMFGIQTKEYLNKIRNQNYDLVLFENIPYLNNFYPFQIRDSLHKYYQQIDKFTAPRNPTNEAFIEVFLKKPIANKLK